MLALVAIAAPGLRSEVGNLAPRLLEGLGLEGILDQLVHCPSLHVLTNPDVQGVLQASGNLQAAKLTKTCTDHGCQGEGAVVVAPGGDHDLHVVALLAHELLHVVQVAPQATPVDDVGVVVVVEPSPRVCLPHHVPSPAIVTRDDNASHVPAHLDRLGVDPANAKLQLLGGLHDEDLVNEGPHANLHEVQVGHEQPQLSDLLPIMVKGELGDVHEQPQLPVLKFM